MLSDRQERMDAVKTFSFGKNWQRFLKSLDEDRIRIARESVTEFLGLPDLKDKTFLDIGCGSGLFSYSAHALGAQRVVSFDYDLFSVECCRYMHEKAGHPANWTIYHGSVLDQASLKTLRQFDVVYSWGVLHHTGDMWQAIKNAAGMVKPGGLFHITIYNAVKRPISAQSWLKIKKLYNRLPKPGKYFLEAVYAVAYILLELINLRNPFAQIRSYKSARGMDWYTDIRDWLGGYPYEFASKDEILQFMQTHFPGYRLTNLRTTTGSGVNWFLFIRN